MLSGFAFPIDQMPAPIRAVTYLVYSRYYVARAQKRFFSAAPECGDARSDAGHDGLCRGHRFFATRAFRKSLQ